MSNTTTPTEIPSPTPTPAEAQPTGCVTVTPGKNGHVPVFACNSYYNFEPEYAPAVAVAVIFSIFTTVHVAEAIIFRKKYLWVLIMGCLWEALSFILHSAGALDQQNAGLATGHSILYLLAPLWINAFAYMTFARMVWYWVPEQKVWILPATRLSLIFVAADILTFLIQGAGGIMASPGSDKDAILTGVNVYIVGLAFQQFFICCFIAVMIFFHRRMLAHDVEAHSAGARVGPNIAPAKRDWKPLLYALYVVLTFISIRVIYRLAEFGPGIKPENPIPWNEAYSYGLDAFPMMICMLVLAIVHPGRSLVGPDSEFPGFREKRAAKKAAKAAAAKEAGVAAASRGGSGYTTDSSANQR